MLPPATSPSPSSSKGLFILDQNGTKLRLPPCMVRQCHTLKNVLDVFADTIDDPLPLPITQECLNFIFQYAKIFECDKFPYISPGRNALFPKYFDQFPPGKLLSTLDMEGLAKIFKAADYLQFDRLLDDITKSIMFRMEQQYCSSSAFHQHPPQDIQQLEKNYVGKADMEMDQENSIFVMGEESSSNESYEGRPWISRQ